MLTARVRTRFGEDSTSLFRVSFLRKIRQAEDNDK